MDEDIIILSDIEPVNDFYWDAEEELAPSSYEPKLCGPSMWTWMHSVNFEHPDNISSEHIHNIPQPHSDITLNSDTYNYYKWKPPEPNKYYYVKPPYNKYTGDPKDTSYPKSMYLSDGIMSCNVKKKYTPNAYSSKELQKLKLPTTNEIDNELYPEYGSVGPVAKQKNIFPGWSKLISALAINEIPKQLPFSNMPPTFLLLEKTLKETPSDTYFKLITKLMTDNFGALSFDYDGDEVTKFLQSPDDDDTNQLTQYTPHKHIGGQITPKAGISKCDTYLLNAYQSLTAPMYLNYDCITYFDKSEVKVENADPPKHSSCGLSGGDFDADEMAIFTTQLETHDDNKNNTGPTVEEVD